MEVKYLEDYYLLGPEAVEAIIRNESLPKWTRNWEEATNKCCNRKCWCSCAFIFCYTWALIINSLGVVSIPWLPNTMVYIVQVVLPFEDQVDGFLNGYEIDEMNRMRMGLWASCYSDYWHKMQTCLPWAFDYHVIVTDGRSSHIVAQPVLVAFLKFQGLAAASTLVTFACGLMNYVHWYAGLAAALTAITLAFDFLLFTSVRNVMKTFGTGIHTQLGPGFGWIVLALIFLLVGCAFQFVEGKAHDKEEKEKAEFKEQQSLKRIEEAPHIKLTNK